MSIREDFEALGRMYLTLTDAMGYDSGKDGLEWSPEEWAAQLLKSHKAQIKAQQEQPAQEPVAWLHGTTFQVVVSKNRPNSLAAWLPLFAHPAPTQPALSDEQMSLLRHKKSYGVIKHLTKLKQ